MSLGESFRAKKIPMNIATAIRRISEMDVNALFIVCPEVDYCYLYSLNKVTF